MNHRAYQLIPRRWWSGFRTLAVRRTPAPPLAIAINLGAGALGAGAWAERALGRSNWSGRSSTPLTEASPQTYLRSVAQAEGAGWVTAGRPALSARSVASSADRSYPASFVAREAGGCSQAGKRRIAGGISRKRLGKARRARRKARRPAARRCGPGDGRLQWRTERINGRRDRGGDRAGTRRSSGRRFRRTPALMRRC